MTKEQLNEYKTLFQAAFVAAIIMLVIIPLQIAAFMITKLPNTITDWYLLFQSNILMALFHSDLFLLIDNILIVIIYLAFYHTLKDTNKGLLQIGLIFGLIGVAAYISSNKTFELLSLSTAYAHASDADSRAILETVGQSVLAGWQGSAFDTYYVLNGITLLIVSSLMYKSAIYGKTTATWGLASGILMIVPSTAGMIGLIFSLLSLIPWYVFSIRFSMAFRKLGKGSIG